MIIYGINAVAEALSSSREKITRVYVRRGKLNQRLMDIVAEAKASGVPVHFDPIESLTRKSGSGRNQGVVAELGQLAYADLDDLLERSPNFLLLADGVEDPRNLGAVLRTAEAAGVQGVLLPDRHSCGITPAVVKSSAGAALHIPVVRIGNVVGVLKDLKKKGFWVVGLDMAGNDNPAELDAGLTVVVVVGGEDRGLRRLVRENCDFLVSLPQKGKVSSLNLSVAAGILLYQIAMKRDG